MNISIQVVVLMTMLSVPQWSQAAVEPSTDQGTEDKPKATEEGAIGPLDLYRELFKQKRTKHMDAVKLLLNIDKYEKQYKMIKTILEEIFKVLTSAQLSLQDAQFVAGDPFPEEEAVKNSYSSVAENTAFFGDVLMRMPDIVHDIMKRNRDWEPAIHWGIGFCNDSKVFTGRDSQLLSLMAQELGIIPKDEHYVNPFKTEDQVKAQVDDVVNQILSQAKAPSKKEIEARKKKRAEMKKKRGPKLAGGHTEL